MSRRSLPLVGIYHAEPEPYLDMIRDVVPDERIRLCTRWDAIDAILGEIDVLLAFKFGWHAFPRAAVLAAPRLRWVQVAGAGADHLMPFDPKEVVVTNASGIHGDIMAQFVLGALVHLIWDFPRLVCQQRDRRWERYEVPTLAGKTLGVLGAGRVGRAIANLARSAGMRIVGTRRSGRPVEGFDCVWPQEGTIDVLTQSDVVVLSLPLTKETLGLVGRRELEALRPTAYFVNVSRGGIVDEPALLDVLRARRIAGAVLDVFEKEPLPMESEFWALPNVFVTPHISSELEHWPVEVARVFCDNLRRWVDDRPLVNVVDPVAGY